MVIKISDLNPHLQINRYLADEEADNASSSAQTVNLVQKVAQEVADEEQANLEQTQQNQQNSQTAQQVNQQPSQQIAAQQSQQSQQPQQAKQTQQSQGFENLNQIIQTGRPIREIDNHFNMIKKIYPNVKIEELQRLEQEHIESLSAFCFEYAECIKSFHRLNRAQEINLSVIAKDIDNLRKGLPKIGSLDKRAYIGSKTLIKALCIEGEVIPEFIYNRTKGSITSLKDYNENYPTILNIVIQFLTSKIDTSNVTYPNLLSPSLKEMMVKTDKGYISEKELPGGIKPCMIVKDNKETYELSRVDNKANSIEKIECLNPKQIEEFLNRIEDLVICYVKTVVSRARVLFDENLVKSSVIKTITKSYIEGNNKLFVNVERSKEILKYVNESNKFLEAYQTYILTSLAYMVQLCSLSMKAIAVANGVQQEQE